MHRSPALTAELNEPCVSRNPVDELSVRSNREAEHPPLRRIATPGSGNEASSRECVLMTTTPEDNAAESEGTASAIRHAKEQHDIDEAYRNHENTGDPWLDPWDEDPDSGE